MLVRRSVLVGLLGTVIVAGALFAHSGGLDQNGGHWNRKTGEYHYHQKKTASTPPTQSQSAAPTTAPAARNAEDLRLDAVINVLVANGVITTTDLTAEISRLQRQR